MNSYYNHIVDLLVGNGPMDRTDLFAKSGVKNKREFITEIDNLISENRIIHDGPLSGYMKTVLFPKVLKLAEFENRNNALTRIFLINYAPTKVLEKALEYIEPGADPFEDKLDFHLEIMGYPLKEKYKGFFEKENGFTLDFNKFHYNLWAEYLHFANQMVFKESLLNIIYIDNDPSYSRGFIDKMKADYIPNSNWLQFNNTIEAMQFLEIRLLRKDKFDLIITENDNEVNGIEFLEALRELEIELENKCISFQTSIIILTKDSKNLVFNKKNADDRETCFHFLKSEDLNILGKVVRSLSYPNLFY